MHRRGFLAAGALVLAGCSNDREPGSPSPSATPAGTPTATPPADLTFGNTYRTADGFHVTVETVETRESVRYDSPVDAPEDCTPARGRVYAFARLRVENAGEERQHAPWFKDYHATGIDGGGPYSPERQLPDVEEAEGSSSTEFCSVDHVVDPDYHWQFEQDRSLPPGDAYTAWLSFVVPDDVTLAVAFTDEYRDGEHTVTWRPG